MEVRKVTKEEGQALAALGMLAASLEALRQPGVLTDKGAEQAAKIQRWTEESTKFLIKGKPIPPVLLRKVKRHTEAVIAIGRAVMPEFLFKSPFVGARLMAIHYFLDHHAREQGWHRRKSWRYLEQTLATFLSMLLMDLQEDEEAMFEVAERMFYIFNG